MDVMNEIHDQIHENDPEKLADLDTKRLKLSNKQRSEVLSIYCEQNEVRGEVISKGMPRRGRTKDSPLPVIYSLEMLSKYAYIEAKTSEKIRNVLNGEQKKKFDREQQAFDRIIERMISEANAEQRKTFDRLSQESERFFERTKHAR